MNCERCGNQLQGTGRYFPGSGYPVQTKREYQHVCVPCESDLIYGPIEDRDAVRPRKTSADTRMVSVGNGLYARTRSAK